MKILVAIAALLVLSPFRVLADEPQYQFNLSPAMQSLDVDDDGFEDRRQPGTMRIRGWSVGDDLYFGQAKVGDRWGLGIVFEKGDTSFGMNHRGVEITRRF